jgi:glutamyl-tRNA reductase
MINVLLAIEHREPGNREIPAGAPIWRTCLREVSFANDGRFDFEPAADTTRRLLEGDAYSMLLEILCGLRSPMLGETQVLGQFKVFLGSLGSDEDWLKRLGQRLLADAREIRTAHLQGLGSRSYGSAVRRHLAGCAHAVLIGTGKLADEVLPFLADEGRSVDQWSRRDDATATVAGVKSWVVDRAGDAPIVPGGAVLVIAAPIPSAGVERVAARYPGLERVIDLRAEVDRPLHVSASVVTLQDLFAQMSASHAFATRHVDAARADIVRRSRGYELREELRPFGWDDLCA